MMHEKYNNYGVLVTISSLLLIVVYSSEAYDEWDLMVTLLTGFFGFSYLKNKINFDWFSSFSASFISVLSLSSGLSAINSIWELFKPFQVFLEAKHLGLSNHLLLVLIASLLISFCLMPASSTDKRKA